MRHSLGCAGLAFAGSLLATGCNVNEEDNGTIVGNPGKLRAARSSTVELTEGDALVLEVVLWDCDDEEAFSEELEVEVNLLEPEAVFAELPDGLYCGAELMLEDLFLAGEGTDVYVEVEASELELGFESADGFSLAEVLPTLWQLGAPDTLSDTLIAESGLVEDGEAYLDLDDEDLAALRLSLEAGSAIYEDVDGDGLVSDGDEALGTLATGSAREDEESTGQGDSGSVSGEVGGCGKRTQAAWLLLLPVGAGLRRRRR